MRHRRRWQLVLGTVLLPLGITYFGNITTPDVKAAILFAYDYVRQTHGDSERLVAQQPSRAKARLGPKRKRVLSEALDGPERDAPDVLASPSLGRVADGSSSPCEAPLNHPVASQSSTPAAVSLTGILGTGSLLGVSEGLKLPSGGVLFSDQGGTSIKFTDSLSAQKDQFTSLITSGNSRETTTKELLAAAVVHLDQQPPPLENGVLNDSLVVVSAGGAGTGLFGSGYLGNLRRDSLSDEEKLAVTTLTSGVALSFGGVHGGGLAIVSGGGGRMIVDDGVLRWVSDQQGQLQPAGADSVKPNMLVGGGSLAPLPQPGSRVPPQSSL